MRVRHVAFCIAALAAMPAAAQMTGFGWFAELAGSCWHGTRADGKPADEQCYRAQYNRFMRGTIKFPASERGTVEGDSVFAYDSNARAIIYTQWSSTGTIGFGEAVLEGDELIFQNRGPDGAEAPTRSVWRRVDADTFRVSRQRRGDRDDWKEETAVTYARVRAGAPKG